MKLNIKKTVLGLSLVTAFVFIGCQKPPVSLQAENPSAQGSYLSVNDFLQKNATPIQTYTVYGGTGGSFTTPQGTTVCVPPNSFTFQNGSQVTNQVTIEFEDIYKKSDMLLSNMPTAYRNTYPLKSAGEFFIKATCGGQVVLFTGASPITVQQPMRYSGPFDPYMGTYVYSSNTGWAKDSMNALERDTIDVNYIFALWHFSKSLDSGTWCNSDDSSYFKGYPQTKLLLQPKDDPRLYATQVYLVFKSINSIIYVHMDLTDENFPYLYAPLGLQCTVVGIGEFNGVPYSSFVPITIGSNQVVNFSLSPTTSKYFMAQLDSLN